MENSTQPAPEELKPQTDESPANPSSPPPVDDKGGKKLKRGSYRPSHKATFIGAAVVAAILAINAGVIYFFIQKGSGGSDGLSNRSEVTLSAESLDKLGVSKNPVGTRGAELIIGPSTRFNSKVTIGSDISIAGKLNLNNTFVAQAASIAKLEGGDVNVQQIGVNGDATMTNANVRQTLSVAGAARIQGPVTLSQLLTVNNSINVAGNLAIGGTLSARNFQASSLTSDTTLTIGGHVLSRGAPPSLSPGGALGSGGTASMSGTDTAGTIAANVGVGASPGIVASITFRQPYSTTPRVIVTPVGSGPRDVYVNRSATGFSIGVGNSMPPGGWAFDYFVIQ